MIFQVVLSASYFLPKHSNEALLADDRCTSLLLNKKKNNPKTSNETKTQDSFQLLYFLIVTNEQTWRKSRDVFVVSLSAHRWNTAP